MTTTAQPLDEHAVQLFQAITNNGKFHAVMMVTMDRYSCHCDTYVLLVVFVLTMSNTVMLQTTRKSCVY